MPYSQIFSNFHYYNHAEADDSSSVFDADTVVSVPDDEVPVPSLPLPLPMPTLTVTATDSYYHHHQLNNSSSSNNNSIGSSHPYPSQEEESRSPPTSISEFLRRHGHINDSTNRQRHAIIPSMTTAPKTTAATNTRRSDSEEISSSVNALNNLNHQIESSSSSLSSSQSSQSSIITKRNNSLFSCPQPTTNCRRKNEANEARWKEKFQELCAYKQQHGHTSIPRSDKQLGMWVGTQRTQYNYFQQNKHSNMTDERIEMLDSIGFEWAANNYNNNRNNKGKIQNPDVLQAHDRRWIKRFEDLLRFKSKYGHVNVSTTNHRDLYKQLAYWVSTQRYQYKLFQRNEGKANITRERIEILNAIGFQWSLKESYRT